MSPMPSDYPVLLHALHADDGGGYLAVVIDLPGCASDGDTPEEAFTNAQGVIAEWLAIAADMNWPIPDPSPPQGAEAREEASLSARSPAIPPPLTTSPERDGITEDYFIVLNSYGRHGVAFAETDPDRADYETTIADLISGQYSDPQRVIMFNPETNRSEDVSRVSHRKSFAALT